MSDLYDLFRQWQPESHAIRFATGIKLYTVLKSFFTHALAIVRKGYEDMGKPVLPSDRLRQTVIIDIVA